MRKTGQDTVNRSFVATTENGNVEIGKETLPSSGEDMAPRVLTLTAADPENGSGVETEATSNWSEALDDRSWSVGVAAPVANLPLPAVPVPRIASLCALQEWEGRVVDIEDEVFVARLVDVTAGLSHETEEASIPLDEISDRDADDMEIGSVFLWVIGHERSPAGTSRRVSRLVFRDLPRVTGGTIAPRKSPPRPCGFRTGIGQRIPPVA